MNAFKHVLCGVAMAVTLASSQAAVISFNNMAGAPLSGAINQPGITYGYGPVVIGDFYFSKLDGFSIMGPEVIAPEDDTSDWAYNGTDYFTSRSFTLSAIDNKAFNFTGMDIAMLASDGSYSYGPQSLSITGTRSDGSTVHLQLSTPDRLRNPTIGNDFVQFADASLFANVVSMSFESYAGSHAFDNFQLSALAPAPADVPEPSSLLLLLAGVLGLAGTRSNLRRGHNKGA